MYELLVLKYPLLSVVFLVDILLPNSMLKVCFTLGSSVFIGKTVVNTITKTIFWITPFWKHNRAHVTHSATPLTNLWWSPFHCLAGSHSFGTFISSVPWSHRSLLVLCFTLWGSKKARNLKVFIWHAKQQLPRMLPLVFLSYHWAGYVGGTYTTPSKSCFYVWIFPKVDSASIRYVYK